MLLPCRPLFDPSPQHRNLARAQRIARVDALAAWHTDLRICGCDTDDHLAVGWIAWHDRVPPAAQLVLRAVFQVEAQRRELRPGTMALEALVRKNWSDIPVEFDLVGQRRIGCGAGRRLLRSYANDHDPQQPAAGDHAEDPDFSNAK